MFAHLLGFIYNHPWNNLWKSEIKRRVENWVESLTPCISGVCNVGNYLGGFRRRDHQIPRTWLPWMSSAIKFSACAETRTCWWWWWNREVPQQREVFVPESLAWRMPLCSMELFAQVKVQTAGSPAAVVFLWFGMGSDNVDIHSCSPLKGFIATREIRHDSHGTLERLSFLSLLCLRSAQVAAFVQWHECLACKAFQWSSLLRSRLDIYSRAPTCQGSHFSWHLSRNSICAGVWQPLHPVLKHWGRMCCSMSCCAKGFVLLLHLTVQKHPSSVTSDCEHQLVVNMGPMRNISRDPGAVWISDMLPSHRRSGIPP